MTEKDLDIAIEKCERIMEFDTRTLKNPESENGWIFEKVYELLQYLRKCQFATDTNVGGNLIDRKAALDVLHGYFDGMLETDTVCPKDLYNEIEALPSAQPTGTNTVQVEDCISREAAVEVMRKAKDKSEAHRILMQLPSAQPEIIRCKDCRYNNDCEIQYSAQSADEFFCGCAERKDNE